MLNELHEHNHYRGWIVTATRRGKRFRRYFSDRPNGKKAALHAARVFRDKLVTQLPPPTKIKRIFIRNTTGVIGVSRMKERTRSGRRFVRYVAQCRSAAAKTVGPLFQSIYMANRRPSLLDALDCANLHWFNLGAHTL